MTEKNTVKELIDQARNTRHWVYEIAAAYLGVPPEEIQIIVTKKETSFPVCKM